MKASQKLTSVDDRRCLKGGGEGGGGGRNQSNLDNKKKNPRFRETSSWFVGRQRKHTPNLLLTGFARTFLSPWKLQSVLESPWISVLTLSNTDSQVSKRSKHRKTYQDKTSHVVEEPKKTDSRLFFALNGVLEKWEMCPWRSLNFLFKKGTG